MTRKMIFEIIEVQKINYRKEKQKTIEIKDSFHDALEYVQEHSELKLDIWTTIIENDEEVCTFISYPYSGLNI